MRTPTKKHVIFADRDARGRIDGFTCHGCGDPVICPCCGEPIIQHGHLQVNAVDERGNITISAVWCSTACLFRALTSDMVTVAHSDWPSSREAEMIIGAEPIVAEATP